MPWINNLNFQYPYNLPFISKLLIDCKVVSFFSGATGYVVDVIPRTGDEFFVIIEWDHRTDKSYINGEDLSGISFLIPVDKTYLLGLK